MEKISGTQLYYIGALFTLSATIITVPSQVIGEARMDSWLAYVIAAAFALLPLYFIAVIVSRFPKHDLYGAMVQRHPFLGRVLSFLYMGFFFFILARDLRILADFVSINLLPFTPQIVIAICISITVLYIARGGIEILARMSQIALPPFIIVFILVVMIIFRDFEFRFMQPMFEFGIIPPLKASWYLLPYFGEIIALPFLFSNQTFNWKYGATGIGITLFAILLLNTYTILSLGTEIPSRMIYAFYEMIRQLRITDFLDRFDLPLVGIWMPAMLTKIAIDLYLVCHAINRMIPKASAKELTVPFAAFGLICSVWFFRDAVQAFHFNRTWPAISLVFQLVIPVFLLAFLRPRKQAARK